MITPDNLIHFFGNAAIYGIAAVIFAETGLLLGFFLPGDSLLFLTGMMLASSAITTPWWLAMIILFLAASMGNQVGFLIGKKAGHAIFNKPESKFFSHKNVEKTHAFFEKHGGRSIILARFVPIIRTFIPVAAGVGEMKNKTFITYSLIGALLWACGVTGLGMALGNIPFVNKNIDLIMVSIVFVSLIPVILEAIKTRKNSK